MAGQQTVPRRTPSIQPSHRDGRRHHHQDGAMRKRRTAPEARQPSQRPAGCQAFLFLGILILTNKIGRIVQGKGTAMTTVHEIPTKGRPRATVLTLTGEDSLPAAADAPDEVLATTGAPQPRPAADVPAERHARPAPSPEHADQAARIPDRWPFVLPAGWAWVKSADSPLAADGLSRARESPSEGRDAAAQDPPGH